MLASIDDLALDNVISFLNLVDLIHLKETNISFYHYIDNLTLTKRMRVNINWEDFEYPFEYNNDLIEIHNLDQLDTIINLNDNNINENLNSTNNIVKTDITNFINTIYFYQVGCNDQEAWIIIFKSNNDLYGLYTASCDYTGFDCRGSIDLYLSTDLGKVISFGLNEEDRKNWYFYLRNL